MTSPSPPWQRGAAWLAAWIFLLGPGADAHGSPVASWEPGLEYELECPLPSSGRPLISSIPSWSYAARGGGEDGDGDGVADQDESLGVSGESLLDFPRYGADPEVPDLFVQADWIACDPIVEYCGPNNSLDQHRMSGPAAHRLAEYFAPDIRLHVDNGVAAKAGDGVHGDWGGAHRVYPDDTRCSPDTLGARFGAFHRVLTYPIGSGGQGTLFGFCSSGNSVAMGVLAQELGHNFGIEHGGNPESFPVNCKPHYRSPMNYAYTYERDLHQFSRGQAADIALDPTAMDEELGLGTTDADVLADLRGSVYRYQVRDDGAIDWNRNGRIDVELVRAAPTWGWASCEQSVMSREIMLGEAAEPVLAWLPDPAAPRLYLVTRRQEDGLVEARHATRFDRCEIGRPGEHCSDFQPGPDSRADVIPKSLASVGASALAGYLDQTDTAHLMLVVADDQGALWSQDMTLDGAGQEIWSEPMALPEPVDQGRADGRTALVDTGAGLFLLAGLDSGALHGWRYDMDARAWRTEGAATWDDGAALTTRCSGFALTVGYQPDLAGPQLYLVLPTGPRCELGFARWDQAIGSWHAIGDQAWSGEPPMSGGRPSLAYMPFDPSVPEVGRFYVAWRLYPAGAGLIAMSEGNDFDPEATWGRFRFQGGAYMGNVWAVVMDGVSLLYDWRFDDNLRATWVYKDQRAHFHAYADGIVPKEMRDQDDYVFLLRYLACSLRGAC